ncbi:MAG: Transcriptional regulatory protein ZraR [bacterium ADurb.BinA186]|nr:MAG: Transcriptional regulatory protein ZraR [bacterium ADurb.BinA186]
MLTRRVLIVDDEISICEMLTIFLENLGMVVTTACDGLVAWEQYREPSFSFDLMILDMVMPKLGGIELFKRWEVEQPNMNTIFMSGFNMEQELKELRKRPYIEFIEKPFDLRSLIQKIQQLEEAKKEICWRKAQPREGV